jgi:hypothetical protein
MKIILAAAVLIFVSFSVKAQTNQYTPSNFTPNPNEIKILDTIAHIPEVISMAKKTVNETDPSQQVSMSIYKRPDTSQEYYWVKLVENSSTGSAPLLDFFVTLSDQTSAAKITNIKHYDPVTSKATDLTVWRQENNTK